MKFNGCSSLIQGNHFSSFTFSPVINVHAPHNFSVANYKMTCQIICMGQEWREAYSYGNCNRVSEGNLCIVYTFKLHVVVVGYHFTVN